jgi:phenylalanyl-tRNA synthetase beta chain
MRVPLSWLREFAPVPADQSGRDVADRLVAAGLEVETVDTVGAGTTGPLVVGQVLSVEELTGFKKPIRFCRVAVGPEHGHPDTPGERGIICGAANFAAGDLVVVALPGATLPGGFAIGSRTTYGRLSDGMICSERELGIGHDADGIMVLPPGAAVPGRDALVLLGIGEEVLDIAVTPDRGYALSIRGVAREAATAYAVPFADPGLELAELPVPASGEPVGCGSEDFDAAALFTLRTILGFDPAAATPMWMRSRLVACGMRPVSLAVDITNYVMLELGQPLHAFDADLLHGSVRPRRAHEGETLETLDHVVRTLDPQDLVIADDSGAIGLAGTMGGLTSEINDATVNIALEAAYFAPAVVARMARRHKLSSEASRRFERGVDRELAVAASARAAALLLELGGGTYIGMTGVEAPIAPVVIRMPVDHPSAVAGFDIPAEVVEQTLASVGCVVSVEGGELIVEPPSWRPDLQAGADLVEEVLRTVGYDHIPSRLPTAVPGRGWTHEQRLRRRAGVLLAGAGYVEAPCYPFLGIADLDALRVPAQDRRRALVRLANPLSEEQPFLRTTLLPGLLAAALRNIGRGSTDLALFEHGSVFRARATSGEPVRPDVGDRPGPAELAALEALLPEQPEHLAVVLTGDRGPAGWWGPARRASWADAVRAVRALADGLGADLQVRTGADPAFHPGRCAEFMVDGVVVGHGGELHPRVVAALGLPARTAAAEVDLGSLIAAAERMVPAPRVGTMPVAKEDVALVVDRSVPAAEVEEVLRAGAGELLESVRLFDEYTGPQVGQGRKSLAFALRFRAPDRTLSAGEVAAAREAAVAAAAQRLGAELRA